MTKIEFQIASDDGSFHVETMWAFPLGENKYKLDNSPFDAYGVSWEDIVIAIPANEEHVFPIFKEIYEKSGNRTIRIILDPPANESINSSNILKDIINIGCSYEGADHKLISINVPANVSLSAVAEYLNNKDLQWEYADPIYEELNSVDGNKL